MLKLFSLIETRQIQAKILQGFRVFAIFAFPSLVRSMRFKAAIADNFILCYTATALCVADVVYFSSPHQRCGKSGKGDSGKRNEVGKKKFDIMKATLIMLWVIVALKLLKEYL